MSDEGKACSLTVIADGPERGPTALQQSVDKRSGPSVASAISVEETRCDLGPSLLSRPVRTR